MQTTITYNVPEDKLEGILSMLGYTEGNKEEFMNNHISCVVLPAITDVFINLKQAEISKVSAQMPSQVRAMVEAMVSIKTV